MMKLKINKTSIKEPRIKIKYQINLDWSWSTNNQKSQAIIFKKRKKKKNKGSYATNRTINANRGHSTGKMTR
jgi:hypothetical protein